MDFLSAFKSPDGDKKSEAFSGLSNLVKTSMGNKLFAFFQEMVKPALQRNEQEIASTYQKINTFIDEVHGHIQRLLQQHEQEVLEIVKEEMGEAFREVRKLAAELNKKIAVRNENEEVWYLSNELDYFKNEALKLFEANNHLRLTNKLLTKTIKDYQIELESQDLALQKLKKKSMKQKSTKKAQQPAARSMRESSLIKLKTKESVPANKRLLTELSSIMRTEVEKEGRQFDDSRINIQLSQGSHVQLSQGSHVQLSHGSVSKHIQKGPILITVEGEDKSIENVAIPNLSAQSYKSKRSRILLGQTFLREKPILQCFDKCTQTECCQDEPADEINMSKTNYDLNLFRNGFKFNAANIKATRIDLPLRSSVDHAKVPEKANHVQSMNSSFLRNKIEDNSAAKSKKKPSSLFKQDGLFPAK